MAPTLTGLQKRSRELASKTKRGLKRAQKSAPRVMLTTLSALIAYWLAEVTLGHKFPVFAATVCISSLGFAKGPRLKVVFDVFTGCLAGILIADVLMMILGQGMWQAGIIIFVCLMFARALNSSRIFSTQIAMQSLILVLYPMPTTGHFSRVFDGLIGGIIAVLVTMIFAQNPQREAGKDISDVLGETKELLESNMKALEFHDLGLAYENLMWSRDTQSLSDSMMTAVESSQETTRLAPHYRGYSETLDILDKISIHTDFALRNCRTISRLVVRAIELDDEENYATEYKRLEAPLEKICAGIACIQTGVEHMGKVTEENHDVESNAGLASLADAQVILKQGALLLDHDEVHLHSAESYAILLIIRELYVDLFRITGMNAREAVDQLPDLELPHEE
ncbi:MAG: FUSC family protein [Micrococcaceae bacterium]